MIDGLRVASELVLASPWLLLVIAGLAVVDALLPIVPSEALIVAAGVAAATGEQNLLLVIGAAAAGAFVGEVAGYVTGRVVGPPLRTRLRPGTQRASAFDQVERLILTRGGTVLLTGRFVPGGRTAATLAAGATSYPPLRFLGFTAVGSVLSAAYQALVGFFGGAAFAGDPLLALTAGLSLATGVGLVVEGVRRFRSARTPVADAPAAGAPPHTPVLVGPSVADPAPVPGSGRHRAPGRPLVPTLAAPAARWLPRARAERASAGAGVR